VLLGEGAELNRVVRHEGWLDELRLHRLTENLVEEAPKIHVGVNFVESQLVGGHVVDPLGVGLIQVCARRLFDRLKEGQSSPVAPQVNLVPFKFDRRRVVESGRDRAEQFLRQVHHPPVVLVRHVALHHRKLRVVEPAQALVPEVFPNLVDALEAPHEQSLEIKFVRNAEVQWHVQRVVVRLERTRRGAAVDGLQNGRFHLQAAPLVEKGAHRRNELGPLPKDIPHVRVDREVDVPLSIPKFLVRHLVVGLLVGLLHDRERAQGLRQQLEVGGGPDGHLAHARAEDEAFDPNDVADVEELREHLIVEIVPQILGADVDLNRAALVPEVKKRRASHHAKPGDATGNRHFVAPHLSVLGLVEVVVKRVEDFGSVGVHVPGIRVRVDAALFERLALLTPTLFLFAEF
jgi:hypothetical protein